MNYVGVFIFSIEHKSDKEDLFILNSFIFQLSEDEDLQCQAVF